VAPAGAKEGAGAAEGPTPEPSAYPGLPTPSPNPLPALNRLKTGDPRSRESPVIPCAEPVAPDRLDPEQCRRLLLVLRDLDDA
jgi:hypothetical protein